MQSQRESGWEVGKRITFIEMTATVTKDLEKKTREVWTGNLLFRVGKNKKYNRFYALYKFKMTKKKSYSRF